MRGWITRAVVFVGVAGIVSAVLPAGQSTPAQKSQGTQVAQGEYAILKPSGGGVLDPYQQEVYNLRESWTLWRVDKGQYRVEGVRRFESPKDEPHANRFVADLTRDLTILRIKDFEKLRWVKDSGPLSCEFLPTRLDCSSGGSDPKREIRMHTPMQHPYGILWPVSPFSFTGITRQVERDRANATRVDLIKIEQPAMNNPVQATILEGPLRYLGDETITAAGKKWLAHKFSLKVPMNPEYFIWTSRSKGLLLLLSVQHEHSEQIEEGIRLEKFEGAEEF
jgi:hypothetical protein